MAVDILLPMIFDAGYKAGAEDAGSGKLLIEAQDLRYALYRIRCARRNKWASFDVRFLRHELLRHACATRR